MIFKFMDGANQHGGSGALFFLDGIPRTKGSFRTFKGGGVRADNPDSIEMQERVNRAASVHWPPLEPSEGPIGVMLTFFFPRPKSHFGSGRNAGKLKASAPEFPITKGRNDLDKLVRLVLDGMTGVVYVDDSQVCRFGETSKLFVDNVQPLPGILIGVRTL